MVGGAQCNTLKSHTHLVSNPQTGKQEYHRSYPTGVKVLSPYKSGFPAFVGLGAGRRVQRISLWRIGFWLENWWKKTLEGTQKSHVHTRAHRKNHWPLKTLDQTNLLLLKGRWWSGGSAGAPWRQGIQALAMLGCLSPPRGCHLPHQTACRFSARQPTG